jgi:hypothetical protein
VIHVSCANDSETVILKQTAVIGKDFMRNACSKNIIACLLIAILCEGFLLHTTLPQSLLCVQIGKSHWGFRHIIAIPAFTRTEPTTRLDLHYVVKSERPPHMFGS